MRRNILGLGILVVLAASGCGASTLKYVVDGQALGDIPVTEKAAVFEAMGAANRTQDTIWVAQYQQALAQKEIDAAANEYEMAKLELDRAKSEREFAVGTKDQNKLVPADARLEVARLGLDTAGLRRDVVKARLELTRLEEKAAERQLLADLARVELVKAQLAVSKGKKPSPDFDVQRFDRQYAEVQHDCEKGRADVEQQQVEVTKHENTFHEKKRDLDAKKQPAATPPVTTTPPPATPAPAATP
jgi:hypothetical protein